MIHEAIIKTIRDIKELFMCFELVSYIKVNFTKSNQLGISMAKSFIKWCKQ